MKKIILVVITIFSSFANDNLNLIMDLPSVQTKVSECKSYRDNIYTQKHSPENFDMSDCMWNGVPDGRGGFDVQPMGEDDKQEVYSKLETATSEEKQKRGVSDFSKYDSVNINQREKLDKSDFKYMKSTATACNESGRCESWEIRTPEIKKEKITISKDRKAFEDALRERLKDILFNKNDKTGLKVINHSDFTNFHKSQLSKNIINVLSEYCLDADPENGFLVPKEKSMGSFNQIDVRKKNMERLSIFAGDKTVANSVWSICATGLQEICAPETTTDNRLAKNNEPCLQLSKQGLITNNDLKYCQLQRSSCELVASDLGGQAVNSCVINGYNNSQFKINVSNFKTFKQNFDENISYSRQRACMVVSYLKNTQKALLATESIEKEWKNRKRDNDGWNIAKSTKKYKVDDIVNIASRELDSKKFDSLKDEEDKKLADINECIKDPSKISETCKDIMIDLEKNDEEVLQKTFLLQAKNDKIIEKVKKGSLDELKDILTESGMKLDDKEVKLREKELREKIAKRYESEKEALIDSYREKFNDLTISKTSANGATNANTLNVNKLQKIKEEIEGKSSDFKQLIHFTNIIAGYLEFGDGKKTQGKNTQSLKRELEYIEDEKSSRGGRNIGSVGNTPIPQNNDSFKKIDMSDSYFKSAQETHKKDLSSDVKDSDGKMIGSEQVGEVFLKY